VNSREQRGFHGYYGAILIGAAVLVASLGGHSIDALAAALPDGLFVKAAPENALGVKDAKQNTKQGQAVVIRGKVGGRAVPFAKGSAIFLVVDPSLPPSQDACGTPWDYCSLPPQVLMENLATVQVMGSDGKPVRADIQNLNGLEPLAEVVIKGTVAKRELNVFLVNADQIYVKPKGN
jgi:hypothetical protein